MAQQQPPRQPRNLAGILNWSASVGANETPSDSRQVDGMGPERREWLREALASLTVDEVAKMQDDLKLLNGDMGPDMTLAQRETALEDLQMLVETIDNASDLYKIGGWPVLLKLLTDDYASIRAGAANVLATALQSNPAVQAHALLTDTLSKLIPLLADADPTVRKKAMYAISAAVREYDPAHKVFLHGGGLEVIKAAMSDAENSVRIKSLFLLRHLCLRSPEVRDQARDHGLLEMLLALVNDDDSTVREQVLCALLLLIEDNSSNRAICQQAQYGLRVTLDRIIRVAEANPGEDQDAMADELSYATDLRRALYA